MSVERKARLLAAVLDELETAVVVSSLNGEELFRSDAAECPIDKVQRPLADAAAPAVRKVLELLNKHDADTASAEHRLELGERGAGISARAVRLDGEFVLTVLECHTSEAGAQASTGRNDSEERGILSPRERDVVELVGRGLTTGEMARELFISQNTVKQHLKRMFQKLEVHNRAQLIATVWGADGSAADAADAS